MMDGSTVAGQNDCQTLAGRHGEAGRNAREGIERCLRFRMTCLLGSASRMVKERFNWDCNCEYDTKKAREVEIAFSLRYTSKKVYTPHEPLVLYASHRIN